MAVQSKLKLAQSACFAGLISSALLTVSALAGGEKIASTSKIYTDWSRDLVETTPKKYRFLDKPFYAGVTGSLGGRLHLLCKFAPVDKSKSISLRGAREANGDFWPAVSLAVSDDREANWTSVGEFNPTVDADLLTVDDQNPKAVLWVPGEPFRSAIGTYRWGRITLINDGNVTAVFALEDLLPPRGRRPEGADFKELLDDREKARVGSTAILHTVTSIHGHLTGEFVYVRDHSLSTIEGGRTTAGDFWPAATFQVGDSNEGWITIGTAKLKGSPSLIDPTQNIAGEPFRVELDAYKKSIGHAEFGKVIFSDSSFVIFSLKSIDPSITEDGWAR